MFLLFGAVARRGAALGWGGDPVPQALLITGIVVAFSASALAVAVLLRLFEEAARPRWPTTRRAGGADAAREA